MTMMMMPVWGVPGCIHLLELLEHGSTNPLISAWLLSCVCLWSHFQMPELALAPASISAPSQPAINPPSPDPCLSSTQQEQKQEEHHTHILHTTCNKVLQNLWYLKTLIRTITCMMGLQNSTHALEECSRNPAPGAKQTGEELQLQYEMGLWICLEQRWPPPQRPQLLLHKTHKLDMVKKTATMRKKEDGSVTSFRMVRLSRNGPNGNGKPVMLK